MIPSIVYAAELEIDNGSIEQNKVTYKVKYKKETGDESSEVYFTIENSSKDVTVETNSGISNSTCSSSSCTIPIQNINAENVPIEIATIIITNPTANNIKNTLTLTLSGQKYSKDMELVAGQTPTTAKPLSTNSNLSKIEISSGTLDPTFSKDITTYTVTGIKDTINSVNITPTCEKGSCVWTITCPTGECSVTNTRRVNLQLGANQVAINVMSEDGTSNKTYILNIYRGELEKSSAYLSSLKIGDLVLSPYFDSLTNDYTATVGEDVDRLLIKAVAEDPKATIVTKLNGVEIEDDEIKNLNIGENTVTITVTSSDEENKQVYTIILTKEEKEEDVVEKEPVSTTKVEKKRSNTLLIIIITVLALAIIGTVGFILFKKKKNKKDKSDKNDKNNPGGKSKEISNEDKKTDEDILEEALSKTGEQNIDEALDDLMKTKKLELGDLDF